MRAPTSRREDFDNPRRVAVSFTTTSPYNAPPPPIRTERGIDLDDVASFEKILIGQVKTTHPYTMLCSMTCTPVWQYLHCGEFTPDPNDPLEAEYTITYDASSGSKGLKKVVSKKVQKVEDVVTVIELSLD